MSPIPASDYLRILPELILTIVGMVVMMADPLLAPQTSRKPLGVIALLGTLGAGVTIAQQRAEARRWLEQLKLP